MDAIRFARQTICEQVTHHHGRVVDSPGDNLPAEFPSAVETIQCAVEIQLEVTTKNLRLGVTRGEARGTGELLTSARYGKT
jgi:adenylate cyclase